jgi:oxygen-independent coproporphyrinogen III oxidase
MTSVYIHIPFCSNICSYCDFCKIYYNAKLVDDYLISLEKEIKANYKNEIIKTLYIGGGTPSSLSIEQLNKLFNILNIFKLDKNIEFTIECNPENTDYDKLLLFKNNHVNRLSVGIQTFNNKYLKFLNRYHNKQQVIDLINQAKQLNINNINVDLIYGLPNQTIEQLTNDIDEILNLNITHISTYSLIIEEHTKLYIDNIKNIDDNLEYNMYQLIINKLNKYNFNHYEISNFAKANYESKHNLNYWDNNQYYGFGLGAHGYLNNIRYENTRNIIKYNQGSYLYQQEVLDKKIIMQNEMILGLRKIKGINKLTFKEKFNCSVEEVFNIEQLINNNQLIADNNNIYIPKDKLYLSNNILLNFID